MKYFDIIPPEPKLGYRIPVGAVERLARGTTWPNKSVIVNPTCLHKSCSECHGSGMNRRGTCVHMISCPCPSCSPTCL